MSNRNGGCIEYTPQKRLLFAAAKRLIQKGELMNFKSIEKTFGKIAKIAYDLNEINREARSEPENLIGKAECYYHAQIEEIAKDITVRGVKVINVAGGSSAGKTTSAKLIAKELEKHGKKSAVVSLDDFFLPRELTPKLPDGTYDFENFTAIDNVAYEKFLNTLIEKGAADKPIFDFVVGKALETEEIRLGENDVIIIEGLHAMNPIFSEHLKAEKYNIYISCEGNFFLGRNFLIPYKILRLMRRCLRDYYKRGSSLNETINSWDAVSRGEDDYIIPFRPNADFILDTTHVYEPLIFKYYLQPLIDVAEPVTEIEDFKNIFSRIGKLNKDLIPNSSFMWEFLVRNKIKRNSDIDLNNC